MRSNNLIEAVTGVTLGTARHTLAVEAAMEIEALCLAMRQVFEPPCEVDPLALRGITFRVLQLSRAALSALSDANDDTDDISRRIGIQLPQEDAA